MAFWIHTNDADAWLLNEFPDLRAEPYKVTSLYTDEYNCIAWAAADTESWWWPNEDGYWPADLPLTDSVENFIRAFQQLNYQPCADGLFEAGFEKVVIYAGADGRVKHMARQLNAQAWTSKLGQAWDIEHETPLGLEGKTYGQAVQYLKRPLEV